MVARRFIAVFYPDSIINTTTIEGKSENVYFKTSGKQILEEGWRIVFKSGSQVNNDENILPEFIKGEKGPHGPDLIEKETQPPKPYTEATLLRAMETAGKQVDDEELRQAMKENGIGRPSTRAAIIETLFKRKYIVKNKKNLVPTITGIQLIETIHNGLLKSPELTGIWEKKLREIEKSNYDASVFMTELKQMVSDIVFMVKREQYSRKIEMVEDNAPRERPNEKNNTKNNQILCPRCGSGIILKGKRSWGCSRYKEGCLTLVPFDYMGKKLTQSNADILFSKGKTGIIRGFIIDGQKTDGYIILDDNYQLSFEQEIKPEWICPKCKKGNIVKGRNAWGCLNYNQGCHVVIPFEFMGKQITEKQAEDLILRGKTGKIKGFKGKSGSEITGRIIWSAGFNLEIEK